MKRLSDLLGVDGLHGMLSIDGELLTIREWATSALRPPFTLLDLEEARRDFVDLWGSMGLGSADVGGLEMWARMHEAALTFLAAGLTFEQAARYITIGMLPTHLGVLAALVRVTFKPADPDVFAVLAAEKMLHDGGSRAEVVKATGLSIGIVQGLARRIGVKPPITRNRLRLPVTVVERVVELGRSGLSIRQTMQRVRDELGESLTYSTTRKLMQGAA